MPDRVIYVEAGDEKSVLICFEEGLRHGGLGAVVAEIARLSLTASRRLQLAAESSGTIGIAIRRWRRPVEAADFGQPTASLTRWRVSVLPATPLPVPGVGRARWQLELIRCRAGESADFEVEACDAKGRLALPSKLVHGPAAKDIGPAAPPVEVPLVLTGRDGRRRVVLALDAAARRAGLRTGMPEAKAQALVPGLTMRDADPAADAKALDLLAHWALQHYAPIAAADPPDGLVIDVTGAAHLHGGEDAMLKGMVAACRLGHCGVGGDR